MKILIIHQHFKTPQTGGAIRSYYLAKALVDKGIQPVVITGANENRYRVEDVEGIQVHYLPIGYDNRYGFYRRSLSFMRFVWGAVRIASRFRKEVRVCYAISVPLTVGLAAKWIKRFYNIPYVFEVGDLWPDAPIQMGFVTNKLFQQSLYGLERSIYRDADAIVALSPAIQSVIEKKIRGKKIHLIPNMADTEFFKPEMKKLSLEKKFGVEGKFVVSYIGAIGVANGLDYFLECARASQRADLPVHFLMCGDGAMLDGLKNSAQRLDLKNLTILPFRNRDGVGEIMNVTDAAFICYKPVPILETGSPNKYFDALAAGKLIIVNFGGWIRDEIERNRCGTALDSRNPTDFVKKITPFLEDKELLSQYRKSAHSLAEAQYSRKVLGQKFAEAMKN